tara:strand:- start:213 stop:1328 length:1116 start_codon:yes stop_codon:yes gene_type:complete
MLTDLQIRNAKPKKNQYKLSDTQGLYLWVNTKGTKTFFYRYKWLGKDSTIKIGLYPKWTLTAAREKRDTYIDDIDNGINPKQEDTIGSTFIELANEWFNASKVNWTDKTEQTNKTRLSYALESFGYKDIKTITAQDVLKVCRRLEKRGSRETAKRTRAIIGSVYKYHMLYDVSDRVKDSLIALKQKNHPHLTDKKDIKVLMDKINNYQGSYETRMALKFVSYTFVRSRPLREAEWGEIDGNLWRIPKEKEKTKRPLIVPLSKQCLTILDDMRVVNGNKKYIFSSNFKKDTFLSESTLGRVLTRMGYGGKHTTHGFRHMASTCLNELEYDGDAIELQLSHAPTGVRGVYNKAKKLSYRTKMMQEWANWLDSL